MRTKVIAVILAASMLVGCGVQSSRGTEGVALASMASMSDIVDYYIKAVDYDTNIKRNITVHETTYETYEVTGEKATRLKELVAECERALSNEEFNPDTKCKMSKDIYTYIKCSLDDVCLVNGKVDKILGALGYYFVDVNYDIEPGEIGNLKDMAYNVGIDGFFTKNYMHEVVVDENFATVVVNKMNMYYAENNINKYMEYNEMSKTLVMHDGRQVDNWNTIDDDNDDIESNEDSDTEESGTENDNDDNDNDDNDSDDNYDDYNDSNDNDSDNSEQTDINERKYKIMTRSDRMPSVDIYGINKIVGYGIGQRSVMPKISDVYNIAHNKGLAGYGIVEHGGAGMKLFGYKREQMTGSTTIRFVFKEDSRGTGEIICTNAYIMKEELTNGIDSENNEALIPEFLATQLNSLVDRADRINVNYDLVGYMNGSIYEDISYGILRGLQEECTGVQRCISKIRQIISRDTLNNAYLVEVESTVVEGPRSVDCYGTYRDTYMMVVQQQEDVFKIIDKVRVNRQVIDEPQINVDSNIKKRLIALNLMGEISTDNRNKIKELLGCLYTAGTNRVLNGPYTSGDITIELGIKDCFSKDKEIISTNKLEYTYTKLCNSLTLYGSGNKSVYNGAVTEWIGGYDNQAEFTTEELIYFEGLNKAYYMQVYYLVGIENDSWRIMERTVLDEYKVDSAEEIAVIQERIQ